MRKGRAAALSFRSVAKRQTPQDLLRPVVLRHAPGLRLARRRWSPRRRHTPGPRRRNGRVGGEGRVVQVARHHRAQGLGGQRLPKPRHGWILWLDQPIRQDFQSCSGRCGFASCRSGRPPHWDQSRICMARDTSASACCRSGFGGGHRHRTRSPLPQPAGRRQSHPDLATRRGEIASVLRQEPPGGVGRNRVLGTAEITLASNPADLRSRFHQQLQRLRPFADCRANDRRSHPSLTKHIELTQHLGHGKTASGDRAASALDARASDSEVMASRRAD